MRDNARHVKIPKKKKTKTRKTKTKDERLAMESTLAMAMASLWPFEYTRTWHKQLQRVSLALFGHGPKDCRPQYPILSPSSVSRCHTTNLSHEIGVCDKSRRISKRSGRGGGREERWFGELIDWRLALPASDKWLNYYTPLIRRHFNCLSLPLSVSLSLSKAVAGDNECLCTSYMHFP